MEDLSRIPTPHISAKAGDFADTVLMPGDPLRAQFIAENFLEDAKLVTSVRNIFGFTGTYKGKRVSVMGSGMGIPSISIYSYELFKFYDVDRIIRIGSAGALNEKCKMMDVVLAEAACTTSSYADQYKLNGRYAPAATWELLYKTYQKAVELGMNVHSYQKAVELGMNVHVGNVLSSDIFYNDDPNANDPWKKMGILCVEMEAAALYMNAARLGKEALTVLTISDEIYSGRELSSEDRQTAFRDMMKLTLEATL